MLPVLLLADTPADAPGAVASLFVPDCLAVVHN